MQYGQYPAERGTSVPCESLRRGQWPKTGERPSLRLKRIPSGSSEPGHGILADAPPKRRTSNAYRPRKAAPCLPQSVPLVKGYLLYG
jgi:hypothetical protein